MRRYTFTGNDPRIGVSAGYVSQYRQLAADRPVHAVVVAPDSEVRDVVVRDTTTGREYVVNDGLVFSFPEPLMQLEARALYPSTRPAKLIAAERCSDIGVLTGVVREGVRVLSPIVGVISGPVHFTHVHAFPIPAARTWGAHLANGYGADAAGGKVAIESDAADGTVEIGVAFADEMGVVTSVSWQPSSILTGTDEESIASTKAGVVAVLVRLVSVDESTVNYELTDVAYGTVEYTA